MPCAVYSVHLCKITENFRNKQTVDEKDLIETLTTIGIFAISVAIGLIHEAYKKRKSKNHISHAPQNRRQSAHKPEIQTTFTPTAAGTAAQKQTSAKPKLHDKRSKSTQTYSFRPEEEGGRAIGGNHPATDDTCSHTDEFSDEQRRKILRTLIIGEVLSTPKFKN